jgi:penicillin-binding protein 1A
MLKKILIGSAAVIGVLTLSATAWFFIVTSDLPSEAELANYEPPITSRVHAGDGKLVAEFATQHRVYVPSEELPDQLIQAFISAEDKTFFEHSGINLWGMFRGTVLNAIQGKRMTGGSTITQQVVKNMLVGDERSIERKVREAVLAMRIEKMLNKEEILELYMNEIYLGGRSYGVGAAALNYFGKSLGQLSLAECALLAALPQAPGKVNPYENSKAAKERRNWVIDRMVANGYVEKAAGETAKAEELTTVKRLDTDENQASAYYVEELRREILRLGEARQLGGGLESKQDAEKAFLEGGLSIRSTLDSNMQLIAQTALRAGLETYDRRYGWRGPAGAIKVTDDFETALNDFANSKEGKEKIAGAGNTWHSALVLSVKGSVSLGIDDGTKGVLAADDVKWAATWKRTSGGGAGIKAGDVVLVSRDPTPDVTAQNILQYTAPTKPSGNTWHLRQIPQLQGALVAMDPHTGRVYAMAGGYSFQRSQYNRAIQARRQPGSSFKPFVYAAAMEVKDEFGEYKWTPSSRVLDAPYVSCQQREKEEETCYKPANYSDEFYGMQTLRVGVEKSRNAMTVRLASDIGLERVSEVGERMGIYDKLPAYEAMALGAGETTPIRLVTAYAEVVNGGKEVRPVMFDRIQNRYGETVFRTDARPCDGCTKVEWAQGLQPPELPDERKQLMDPVTAYQLVSILEGVVERGTAASVKAIGKPVGAKTGTTNDQVDAWTMGFTPDLVVGVWVGFDTPRDMGNGETGGRVASPIFRDFLMAALKDQPGKGFRAPRNVEFESVDAATGCLAGPGSRIIISEAFQPGSAPKPNEPCEADSGSAGYSVDYTLMVAGDESTSSTRDGQVVSQPGPDVASTSPQPTDPNAPQPPVDTPQPQNPSGELTFKPGETF